MTLSDAKGLAVKVLSKTLDMTKLTSEKGNNPTNSSILNIDLFISS